MNKKLYMLPMCLMLFSIASCGDKDNTSSIDSNTTDTSITGDSVTSSDTPQISDDSSTSIVVPDNSIDIAAAVPTLVPTTLKQEQISGITDFLNKVTYGSVDDDQIENILEVVENTGIGSDSIDSIIDFGVKNYRFIAALIDHESLENINLQGVYDDAKVLFNALEDDDLGRLGYCAAKYMISLDRDYSDYCYKGGVTSVQLANKLASLTTANPEINAFYKDIAANFKPAGYETVSMTDVLTDTPDLTIYTGRVVTYVGRALLNNLTFEEFSTYINSTHYVNNGIPNPTNITNVINKVGTILSEITFTEASYEKLMDILVAKIEQTISTAKKEMTIVDNTLLDGIQGIVDYVKTELTPAEIKSVYTGLHTLLSNIKKSDVAFIISTALEIMSAEDITKVDFSPAVVKVSQILSRTAQEMKAEDVVNIQNVIKDILKLANEKVIGTFVSYTLINLDIDLLGTNIFTFAGFDVDDLTAEQTELVNEYLGTVMESIFGDAKKSTYTKYNFNYSYYYMVDDVLSLYAYDENGDSVEYTDLTNFSTSKEGTFVATFKVNNQVYTYNYSVTSKETYNSARALSFSSLSFSLNQEIGADATTLVRVYKNGYYSTDYVSESIRVKLADLNLDLTTPGIKYGFYKYESIYQYFPYVVWPEDTSSLDILNTYVSDLDVGGDSTVTLTINYGYITEEDYWFYYSPQERVDVTQYVDRTSSGEKTATVVLENGRSVTFTYEVYEDLAVNSGDRIVANPYAVYLFTSDESRGYTITFTHVEGIGIIDTSHLGEFEMTGKGDVIISTYLNAGDTFEFCTYPESDSFVFIFNIEKSSS